MAQKPNGGDPLHHAKAAGLRYVTDAAPGIRRIDAARKSKKRTDYDSAFAYVAPNGRRVTDAATLKRIRSLAIPPAYTDVWICTDPEGHLQAVGRDARGRKQYRYHPRWREVRDDHKYGRVMSFARALPKIRARTRRDIAKEGMPREKVLATVVQLMEKTLIRVGNDEYARQNGSYGLTTMKNRHATVRAGKVKFQFRGKSGKDHSIELDEPHLAKIVKRCQDLPGQELFAYVDENGTVRDVGSADVNGYLRDIAGDEFTAKDFRTWAGTVLAAQALREIEELAPGSASKKNVTAAIEKVAGRLGNTKAVCRKCYVHPEIIGAYLDGALVETLKQRTRSMGRLPANEAAVLHLLEKRLEKGREPLSKKLQESIRQLQARRGVRAGRKSRPVPTKAAKAADRRPAAA